MSKERAVDGKVKGRGGESMTAAEMFVVRIVSV